MCTLYSESWRRMVKNLRQQEGGISHTFGAEASLSSITSFLSFFISRMQVSNRPPGLISSSLPFSHRVSLMKEGSAREVVVLRRWSWSRVTESEELVGKMSLVSRLPQYLEDHSHSEGELEIDNEGSEKRGRHAISP